MLVVFLLLLGLLGLEVWWRQRKQQQRQRRRGAGHLHGRGNEETADAAACGLEAGACFGFSAAACRTGFQLAPSLGWVLVPMGLAASVGLTSSGFVLQVRLGGAGEGLGGCGAVPAVWSYLVPQLINHRDQPTNQPT